MSPGIIATRLQVTASAALSPPPPTGRIIRAPPPAPRGARGMPRFGHVARPSSIVRAVSRDLIVMLGVVVGVPLLLYIGRRGRAGDDEDGPDDADDAEGPFGP